MKTNTKMIAASLSFFTSIQAVAGLGGLNVQSNLGEPFSGSIVVTGSEAQALLQSGSVSVSGGGVRGSVVPQGNGNAVIRLRSASAINEPVLTFTVKAGNQTRQYSAMVNPARYAPAQNRHTSPAVAEHNDSVQPSQAQSKKRPVAQTEYVEQSERKSRPERAKARARKQGYPRPQPLPPRDSNAQYHQVRSGEHLAAIAEQYRPHNMTLQQAMRALVRANPRAFRNGNPNVLYGNMALYIPTDAQWHAYASGKGSRRGAIRRPSSVVQAPADVSNKPTVNVETNTTPPVATPPVETPKAKPEIQTVPQASSNVAPAVKPESNSTVAASVSNTAPVASTAAVEQPAASTVSVVASAPIATSSETATSSVPATASTVASAASLPASKPEVPVSAPVEQKPAPAAPVAVETEAEEEGTDWMQYGLMGLGGLAVLGGAAYVLGRRKRSEAQEDSDDDEFVAESLVVPTAAQAAQRVDWENQNQSVAAQPEFNAQDDNVFFDNAASAQAAEFDLNNFNPEMEAGKATAESEEQPEWMAELESFNQSVQTVDENDWEAVNPAVTATAGAAALAANTAEEDAFVDFGSSTDDEFVVAEADGDEWLQEVLAQEQPEVSVAQPEEDLSFDSFAVDESFASETETVVESQIGDFDFNDTISQPAAAAEEFDLDAFATTEEFVSGSIEQPETDFAAPAYQAVEEVGFDLPASDIAEDVSFDVVETPSVDADALSFDVPETAVEDLSFDLPETAHQEMAFDLPDETLAATVEPAFDVADIGITDAEPVSVADDLAFEPAVVDDLAFETADVPAEPAAAFDDLAFDLDAAPVEPVSEPIVEAAQFGLADDLAVFEETAVDAPVAAIDEPVKQQDVGFVTGAVGMEAPLEAKLELAKMYLEIDDAVAARETLRELIGESSGDLQAQAQSLLNELGG